MDRGALQATVLGVAELKIIEQSEWLLSKSLQAINAGEGVEKRKLSYTVGGNANQFSHYGEQCGDSLKHWK